MTNNMEFNEASQQYATAYTAHYSRRELPLALELYEKLIASQPNSLEAEFSRMQIQNIVNAVVPKQERLEVQLDMARHHCDLTATSQLAAVSITPLALGVTE